jgi:hypothetical protein
VRDVSAFFATIFLALGDVRRFFATTAVRFDG